MKKSVTRLFDQFKPSHYNLEIKLDPTHEKFSGSVIITGRKTGRPSKRLSFHQKDLRITGAQLVFSGKSGEKPCHVSRINTHGKYNEVRLHSDELLYPGEYSVTMKFTGRITVAMNGVYPCYFKQDGQDCMMLATQFESHHAREAFPCIDEPEAKATFSLSLITPKSGTVLSNTPVHTETSIDNLWRKTDFEPTPVMSTYLLAFAFGDVDYLEAKTKRGTIVRTYATRDNVMFTTFALETGVRCLEFYEDYFGIEYPLAKCDMIALPDFASGAMENWGLITYREQTLLVDPKNTSVATKQYVAMVVAHELAHQWFGNLVTMQWWTDLWLNEGFASWIEYLAVDRLFPDWQMWTQFAASEQQPAFKLDALENTHPVEVPISHPDEIRTIFDTISYSKGASVIHMLHAYLGPEMFRDGLRHYLKHHAYKNAVTADLWDSLETVSGKPVKAFMHAWTSQPGFPLVAIDAASSRITQERFYFQKPEKTSHSTWPVPVLGPLEGLERLDTPGAVYNTANSGKINLGQSGFYRTLYDKQTLAKIAQKVTKLAATDRLGLLADYFEAAKSGHVATTEALSLLEHYQQEDNAAVWDIIAANIGELRRIMDDDTVREAIKPYLRKLTGKQLQRLGWEESAKDSYFDKLLRPTILALSSSADETDVVHEALRRFKAAESPEDLPADLRSVIYGTAARHGDEKTFNKLLAFHDGSASSEERTTLAAALTNFEDPMLSKKALSLVTSDTVRRQDAMYWVAYSFMNRHAKKITWEWLKKNWQWLEDNLGTDLSFYRTPIYAARSFSSRTFAQEFDKFFVPKLSPAIERSVKQGQEMLSWQIAWKERDLEAIKQFFS